MYFSFVACYVYSSIILSILYQRELLQSTRYKLTTEGVASPVHVVTLSVTIHGEVCKRCAQTLTVAATVTAETEITKNDLLQVC